MRNPFRNKAAADQLHDDEGKTIRLSHDGSLPRPDSQPLSIRSNGQEKEPTEYKLSEINDSGVYLPVRFICTVERLGK